MYTEQYYDQLRQWMQNLCIECCGHIQMEVCKGKMLRKIFGSRKEGETEKGVIF